MITTADIIDLGLAWIVVGESIALSFTKFITGALDKTPYDKTLARAVSWWHVIVIVITWPVFLGVFVTELVLIAFRGPRQ